MKKANNVVERPRQIGPSALVWFFAIDCWLTGMAIGFSSLDWQTKLCSGFLIGVGCTLFYAAGWRDEALRLRRVRESYPQESATPPPESIR